MSPHDPTPPPAPPFWDDAPLWSAPFGLALLARVRLGRGLTLLDLGTGTGFPLLELAERLGPGCRLYGLDPWAEALHRAAAKRRARGVSTVQLVQGVAERLPFPDAVFDRLTSNNGLNNVADLDAALAEAARVARPGAQLVCTWNLPETMALFYDAFAASLTTCGLADRVEAMRTHIHEKRKPVDFVSAALERAGFVVEASTTETFDWRFATADALLDHSFIRLGFRPAWEALLPEPRLRAAVFADLRNRLDRMARTAGEVALSVPLACISAHRKGLRSLHNLSWESGDSDWGVDVDYAAHILHWWGADKPRPNVPAHALAGGGRDQTFASFLAGERVGYDAPPEVLAAVWAAIRGCQPTNASPR